MEARKKVVNFIFYCIVGGQAYTFKMAFSNNTSLDNDTGPS